MSFSINGNVVDKGVAFIGIKNLFIFAVTILNLAQIKLMYGTSLFVLHKYKLGFSNVVQFDIFIILHLFFLKRFALPLYLSHISKKWLKVLAKIKKYETWKIEEVSYKVSITSYFPYVLYQYKIDKKTYQNDKISFYPEKVCEDTIVSFNLYGKKDIEIFVNPLNYQQSVIKRTLSKEKYIFYTLMSISSLVILLHYFWIFLIDSVSGIYYLFF